MSQPTALVLAGPIATPAPFSLDGVPLDAFLRGLAPSTRRVYGGHLRRFADWLGVPHDDLALQLASAGRARCAVALMDYAEHLGAHGNAAGTVNVATSAALALLTFLRTAGVVEWRVEPKRLPARAYRDTAGPGTDAARALLAAATRQPDALRAARDAFLVHALFGCALRQGEVIGLDLVDVDRDSRGNPTALWIRGKGKVDRERITLPGGVARALAAWLAARGDAPGPLVTVLDRRHRKALQLARLSPRGIEKVLARLGALAGVGHVRPHGLRHSAITQALDEGIPARDVLRFSRHAKLETLMRYDDNRADLGGKVAARVAGLL